MNDEFLWVEKYRPKTIEDCVLPADIKQTFFDSKDEIPNMILTGTAGTGKTTIAKALCEMHNCDYILINGSEESGIDVLRTKIKNFASTVSLGGGNKVVILDEADYLNAQSTQPALRGFIEEFHKNCRFIFTCNFKNRLIAPLHSRCTVIDFKIPPSERPRLASVFMARLMSILDDEGVKYNTEVLQELVMKFFPDFRRTINELQRYSISGSIDVGILSNISDDLRDFLLSPSSWNIGLRPASAAIKYVRTVSAIALVSATTAFSLNFVLSAGTHTSCARSASRQWLYRREILSYDIFVRART